MEGSTNQQFSICLVNISGREISLDSGTVVGSAFPILVQVQHMGYDAVYPVATGPEDSLQKLPNAGSLAGDV